MKEFLALFRLPASQYLLISGLFFTTFALLFFIKKIVISRLEHLSSKTEADFDDFLIEILRIWDGKVLFVFSLTTAIWFSDIPSQIKNLLLQFSLIVAGFYVIRSFLRLIDYGFKEYVNRRRRVEENFDKTIVIFLKNILKISVLVAAVLVIIQNMGFEVSALLGGLGIGGLAVAFAVQNLLVDIFSSISIYFDKPFKVGDFIVVGEDSGTVKRIGLKSTRIRTLRGEELVISNKELTEARVRNFRKMSRRRVALELQIEYETPHKKVEKVPKLIETVIKKVEGVEFDRAHLKSFGSSSLDFEVVYYVESEDYLVHMDCQQQILLGILSSLAIEKINLAYPAQRMVK